MTSYPRPPKQVPVLLAAWSTASPGCLKPKGGKLLNAPAFQVRYDPTYYGGALAVTAFGRLNSTGSSQIIGLSGEQLAKTGTYVLGSSITLQAPGLYSASYMDNTKPAPCDEHLFKPARRIGTFTITRLDRGIVSGTFAFTLI